MTSLAEQYRDPRIQTSPAAEDAISALIFLCQRATDTTTPVIHAWFL
jgi:hypothetical protein